MNCDIRNSDVLTNNYMYALNILDAENIAVIASKCYISASDEHKKLNIS